MQYRKNRKGEDISVLGFDCMRFTTKAGRIDVEKTERETGSEENVGEPEENGADDEEQKEE